MKKIFATLVVCFVLMGSSDVYALTPADLKNPEERFQDYDEEYLTDSAVSGFIADHLRNYIQIIYERTGEEVTWIMHNLNDKQNLQIILMYENGEIKTYSSNDVVCKSHKYFKAGAIMNKNALKDLGFPFVHMSDNIITRNKFSEEAIGEGIIKKPDFDTFVIEDTIIEKTTHHKLVF